MKKNEFLLDVLAEISWYQYCYDIEFEESVSMFLSKKSGGSFENRRRGDENGK